ncbi:hypothetical protein LR48_Vigan04g203400 [Vigna angularis]|uniref:Uncharacterized protein n=1 Tax=Phaseolus angularis TaxID=3914 RepID=A0A0L9UGJ4_PHAAN|nr:hypothetical protein LR48_Vigan04g203400 [Vigna angularis]
MSWVTVAALASGGPVRRRRGSNIEGTTISNLGMGREKVKREKIGDNHFGQLSGGDGHHRRASSNSSSPYAHIHTDDHCNDKDERTKQDKTGNTGQYEICVATTFVHPGDVVTGMPSTAVTRDNEWLTRIRTYQFRTRNRSVQTEALDAGSASTVPER